MASLVRRWAERGELHRTGASGRRLAWRRFGRGPALVLLHGGHGSWLHWVRNIEALASAHTVFVPDLPGYGDSDVPDPPTLDGLLRGLDDGLDELVGAGAAFVLAGFSFGGLVAAHVAARRKGVAGLALFGPAGHRTTRRPRAPLRPWRELRAEAEAGGAGQAALGAVMRHNLAAHMLHSADAVDELALGLHTDACLRTRLHSKPISRSGDLRATLEAYAAPLCVWWGEHDVTATPQDACALFGGHRPEVRSLIVPGAGHWVQYEAASVVNDALRAFAASVIPRT